MLQGGVRLTSNHPAGAMAIPEVHGEAKGEVGASPRDMGMEHQSCCLARAVCKQLLVVHGCGQPSCAPCAVSGDLAWDFATVLSRRVIFLSLSFSFFNQTEFPF